MQYYSPFSITRLLPFLPIISFLALQAVTPIILISEWILIRSLWLNKVLKKWNIVSVYHVYAFDWVYVILTTLRCSGANNAGDVESLRGTFHINKTWERYILGILVNKSWTLATLLKNWSGLGPKRIILLMS